MRIGTLAEVTGTSLLVYPTLLTVTSAIARADVSTNVPESVAMAVIGVPVTRISAPATGVPVC
jgi:hypothetical protein